MLLKTIIIVIVVLFLLGMILLGVGVENRKEDLDKDKITWGANNERDTIKTETERS